MNRNNIYLILVATGMFSYLFYMQSPGFNHAVFTYILIALLALTNISIVKNPKWIISALACLMSGTVVGITGTELNILINLLCILVLTYVTASSELSIITGTVYAGLSSMSGLFISGVSKLSNYVTLAPEENQTQRSFKWYYLVLPLGVLIIFLILYRESSGAFMNLTNKIDLSFLSPQWFIFTFIGFLFIYGLFIKPKEFDFFKAESSIPNEVAESKKWKTNGFLTTGIILFIMLDFLLLIVNISDVAYLSFINIQKMDMSYADLIHQGVGSMIVSLVLAVVFILLWINQQDKNPKLSSILKISAIIWITLNLIMLATNIYKNMLYIDAYGLTYKRVGVYFFLLMAFLTLVFCAFKIMKAKNNMYIYRRFGLIVLTLAITFNCFNWNKIISSHNIDLYKSGKLSPDANYLLELSSDCLPMIVNYWPILNPTRDEYLNRKLDFKCKSFVAEFEEKNWRSLTLNNYHTFEKLKTYKPRTSNSLAELEGMFYYERY